MKKQTKHFPFLKIQQQRFVLNHINHSSANHLPSQKQFYQWIWHALKNHYRRAEISLVLLDQAAAQAYNRDYRGKDYATNVLSFAHDDVAVFGLADDVLRGDVIICPQIVAAEAAEQGKILHHHYAHLVIHGTLHLMGFDHIHDDEAQIMENQEIQLLQQLNIANPYE